MEKNNKMKKYVVISRQNKMRKLPKGDQLFYVTYNDTTKGICLSIPLAYIEYNSKIGKYSVESLAETTRGYNRVLRVIGSTRFTNELHKLVDDKKLTEVVYPYNDKDIEIINAQLSNAMNNM